MLKLFLIRIAHQIKLFIPPIIWSFTRKYFMPDSPQVFEGEYSSLSKVKERGYNTSDSLENSYNETLRELNDYKHLNPPQKSNSHNPIANLLPLVAALVGHKKEISILDFGGGMGRSYLSCLSALQDSNISIDYHIVDLEDTIEYAMKIYPDNMDVHFYRDIPDTLKDVDIVYLGSTLQYINAYEALIQRLAKLEPKYFFLTDYFTSPSQTFATAQVNMKDRRIAYWIFNLREIVGIVEQQGYKKIYETKNHQPIYNFSNAHIIDDSCNLLFSRDK